MKKIANIYYLTFQKAMANTSKKQRKVLSYDPDKVKRQIQLIPGKLDQFINARHVSYNSIASIVGFRPEILYRVRDGESLPACESIINIKNVLPDLNLNWWLCDQGEASIRENEVIEQENKRLHQELAHMRAEVRKVQQQLAELINTGGDTNS